MPGQASKFKIGLFVVTGLLLLATVFVWLGASRYFEDSKMVVAYFTESVQGLESDSPVKYRGVPVGRVKAIRMAPDAKLIEVTMSLNRNFKLNDDLGVKINLLGLTGQKYLEMDNFRPDQLREQISLDFTPRYPVIPTYPSDIREIGNALENLFQKVKGVELERVTNNFIRISARLDKMLADPQLDDKLIAAEKTLQDGYRKFAQHFPPAVLPDPEEARRLGLEVEDGYKKGQNFVERELVGIDLSAMNLKGICFKKDG